MKKLINFSILFLLFAALSSCFKRNDETSGQTYISGKITEFGTGKAVSNATVVILKASVGALFSQGGELIPLDTVYTDSGGNYAYDYATEDKFRYAIQVFKIGYFESDKHNGNIINDPGKNKMNIILKPKGYIRFYLKNTKPFDSYDRIAFGGNWNGSLQDDIFIGDDINEVQIREVESNTYSKFYFYVTKNKIQIETRDSLYLKAADTLNYKFQY